MSSTESVYLSLETVVHYVQHEEISQGNCDRSVRHYFWLFFSVLTTETDIWEV